ncbi:MAG TPA: glycosyltransferase family 39 protein [Chthoniobacterales bacterium]|nr:glycosyltransferase family 39 protein [Chthoniobacterales bacterium]
MSTRKEAAWHCFLVLAVWAAIYLPGLGTLEIKGEEGRRILPAIAMLQSGNYIVPQVGSEPYFRKPPLVNWLVAGSFKLLGQRSEWTARIPSALSVLVVAVAFLAVGRGTLGATGALLGALVWMTNFGVIEKGRLIEIEAVYVSLCGLALIFWLSAWYEQRSRWITWTVPWIFLGLGLLAKGPLLLLFFYAVILSVLFRSGELRSALSFPHALGLLLMLGIFAAWAVPCLLMMSSSGVTQVWTRQLSGRISGENFQLGGWLLNIPRGLCYFLPWTPLLALARSARFAEPRRAALAQGLTWAVAVSFLGLSLVPGALARYTMPLLAPAAWLIAMILTAEALAWPRGWQLRRPNFLRPELRLPAIVTVLVCAAIALYAVVLMPFLQQRAKIRNLGAEINAKLATPDPLYAVAPDYQPLLFYVRDPIAYLDRIAEVPADAKYLLVQPAQEGEATASRQWNPRWARPILRLKDYRNKEVILLEIGPAARFGAGA